MVGTKRLNKADKRRGPNFDPEIMDSVAHTFEKVKGFLAKDLGKLLEAIESPVHGERLKALREVRDRFGSVTAANEFFRMYLRSRGLPETIRKTTITDETPTRRRRTIDGKPKAKTLAEAQKIAENAGNE